MMPPGINMLIMSYSESFDAKVSIDITFQASIPRLLYIRHEESVDLYALFLQRRSW